MGLFREFALILLGGLIGTVLGGGFGTLIGTISPEFMDVLTHPHKLAAPERVGAALGMTCGVLIGASAMAAGRFVSAVRLWAVSGRVGRGTFRDGASEP